MVVGYLVNTHIFIRRLGRKSQKKRELERCTDGCEYIIQIYIHKKGKKKKKEEKQRIDAIPFKRR